MTDDRQNQEGVPVIGDQSAVNAIFPPLVPWPTGPVVGHPIRPRSLHASINHQMGDRLAVAKFSSGRMGARPPPPVGRAPRAVQELFPPPATRRRGEARPRRKAKPALQRNTDRARDTCDDRPRCLAPQDFSTATSIPNPLNQTTERATRLSCFADEEEGFPEPPRYSLPDDAEAFPRAALRQSLHPPRGGEGGVRGA